jgi:hypothetical protein
LVSRGVVPGSSPGVPDGFAFAQPGRIEELLGDAGFTEIVVDAVDFAFESPDLDAWWSRLTETSGRAARAIAALSPAEHYELRDAFDAAYAPFVLGDGSLRVRARTLVAAATA